MIYLNYHLQNSKQRCSNLDDEAKPMLSLGHRMMPKKCSNTSLEKEKGEIQVKQEASCNISTITSNKTDLR